MEFGQINDDCVEQILKQMSGIDIVRFGITNKRYLQLAQQHLRRTRLQLRASHLNFFLNRDSATPVDTTRVHFRFELKYIDPHSKFCIYSDGPEFERRSFAYNAALLRDAMEMAIGDYIFNRDFSKLNTFVFDFKMILGDTFTPVYFRHQHRFESIVFDLFAYSTWSNGSYDLIPDFQNKTIDIKVLFYA